MAHQWSPEEKAALRDLYAQGFGYAEIAEELTRLFGRKFTGGMVTGQIGVLRLARKRRFKPPPGAQPVTNSDEIRGLGHALKVRPGHAKGWFEVI